MAGGEPIISGQVGLMTTKRISADERQSCLDWMRAEFRAAQERRYEMYRRAKEVRVAEPKLAPQAETPTVETSSE